MAIGLESHFLIASFTTDLAFSELKAGTKCKHAPILYNKNG